MDLSKDYVWDLEAGYIQADQYKLDAVTMKRYWKCLVKYKPNVVSPHTFELFVIQVFGMDCLIRKEQDEDYRRATKDPINYSQFISILINFFAQNMPSTRKKAECSTEDTESLEFSNDVEWVQGKF